MTLCSDVKGNELWELNGEGSCTTLTARLARCAPIARDVSLWVESNNFVRRNFADALRMMATGDDEVVVIISDWARHADVEPKAVCDEWCSAVERIVRNKATGWSEDAISAVNTMLNTLKPGVRSSSSSPRASSTKSKK